MKTIIISAIAIIIVVFTLFLASCTPYQKPPGYFPEGSATFKVDGTVTTIEKPYNGVFNDSSTVSNTVTLNAKDSSKIKFFFEGTNTKTLQLKAFPDAVYTNPQGQNYNVVRGQLNITNYNINQSIYTFSGTFNFVAKSIANANDSVVITEGVIANCSNRL